MWWKYLIVFGLGWYLPQTLSTAYWEIKNTLVWYGSWKQAIKNGLRAFWYPFSDIEMWLYRTVVSPIEQWWLFHKRGATTDF